MTIHHIHEKMFERVDEHTHDLSHAITILTEAQQQNAGIPNLDQEHCSRLENLSQQIQQFLRDQMERKGTP